MSILIDELIYNHKQWPKCEIGGKWYLSGPIQSRSLINRLKDAILIMRKKANTYHYKNWEARDAE